MTVFIFTMLSFVIACLVAIFRGFYFMPISNPAEIFDNNVHLPIIGVVPKIEGIGEEELEQSSEDEIKLNSSIESLIVNINSIQNNQNDQIS